MKRQPRLCLEALEGRLVPAFNFSYQPAVDTWTVTQVQDDGDATITVDGGNNLVAADGAGSATVGTAGANLVVNMLSGGGDALEIALETGLTGSLTLNLQHSDRAVDFTGAANSVGGNLRVTAGNGIQSVALATNAALTVGGSANIDLGLGNDSITSDEDAFIGSDMLLRGVNHYNHTGDLVVGRDYSQSVNMENVQSDYAAAVGGTTTVGRNFNYLGNSLSDEIFLIDGATIGGNVTVNLGTNFDPAFRQELRMEGANPVTIGGNVTLLAGFNIAAQPDTYLSGAATTIGGNIYVNFGEGTSRAEFLGALGGNAVTFIGGTGTDTVTFGLTGSPARFDAQLGAGVDEFTLNAGSALSYLSVDFGAGADVFTNNFGGPFTFPAFLRNLP